MKKILNHILVVSFLCIASNATGQQTRLSNLYTQNKYSFNPAYAGFGGCTEVYFSHMNQWTKLEGAPLTNYLSANTRIGKSLGLGANVLLDQIGMYQNMSASGSIAYGFNFAKFHTIRFGLSAGYFQTRLDPTGAIAFDNADVIVNGGIQSSSALSTDAGILYKFKRFQISFASQQLFETRSNFNYSQLDGYGLKRHFTGFTSYEFLLNKRLSLTPSILYKSISNNHQLDFNADFNYNDFISGGLGYRMDVGLIGRIGVNIRKLFFIGYAYVVPMQNIASYSGGSHEIALGLRFCKKKKEEFPNDHLTDVEPISRSVDTVTIVEHTVDTLVIERVDTVFIERPMASDVEVKEALVMASEHLEFENDKSIILKKSYGDLEALTNLLLIREELNISLSGHTDNNGTEAYNMRLSENRVKAVKKFLMANGVDGNRIKTSHFGESKPISDNKTEEGRSKNRRVEMEVGK
ncbi:PorP/SprF family type IX secretion system membrane protein [Crocinitomicaceae bacterium]|nr:PorP/SprF family type IX secretion system membrane protein [Crocinitomicaceae bacterium]